MHIYFAYVRIIMYVYTYYHRQWIKASVSLTVVMGITWIIGFLVIEVEELFALAYIFTIFVAFQGVFIFVIFVLLSKQVKENYAKWWKAKVAESDFLSKRFGIKILTSGTGVVSNYTLVYLDYKELIICKTMQLQGYMVLTKIHPIY